MFLLAEDRESFAIFSQEMKQVNSFNSEPTSSLSAGACTGPYHVQVFWHSTTISPHHPCMVP